MTVRAEEEADWTAVYAVNASAFETPAEAQLVDALREQAQPVVSLVAEDNGKVVGHIMFSPVSLSGHPEYYPRFGFSPSCRFGIDSEYRVPEEVFMATELQPGALSGKHGTITYHAAFSDV